MSTKPDPFDDDIGEPSPWTTTWVSSMSTTSSSITESLDKLTRTETLATTLTSALSREKAVFPILAKLGVSESDLRVLRGEEQLLRILMEEAQRPGNEQACVDLRRVLDWHGARLQRVVKRALTASP